jgi:glycosyltransferase involved in cell wall biosynthesis
MPGVLAQASIVCLPSTYGEGIPKVLLEAGAAGRPTVATDIAGCREVVMDGENGFLVPRGDAAALAARIEALAADGDLRVRMGRAARAVTEAQFAEEAIVAQTLHVYDVLTDRSDGAEFGLARDGKEA